MKFKFSLERPLPSLHYTAEQQAVAACQADRIVVRALAGTGKTETVALRVQQQLDCGLAPSEILVTTFTRFAREQIRRRLRAARIHGVTVKTLHAVALSLLRRNGYSFPLSDGTRFMRRALALKNLDSSPRAVAYVFEALRRGREGGFVVTPASGFKAADVRSVVGLYQRLKEEQRAIDFDDLFFFAADLVKPSFAEVIVDEAQDLTGALARFAAGLSRQRVVLIGDANQAIFGWNGSDGSELDVDDAVNLTLSRSFRSSPEILAVAERLISERFSTEEPPGRVTFTRAVDTHAQAVVAAVEHGAKAVLGRTKRELHQWAGALEEAGFSVDRTWLLESERDTSAPVKVQTIHSAKGGEWDHVVLAGLGSEGFRAAGGVVAEDRRLLYVGATRARRRLDLVFYDALPFEWAGLNGHGSLTA